MSDDEDHAIEAYYDNGAAMQIGALFPLPSLACSCGFTATGDSWEEVGVEMDEHIDEIRSEEP